MPKFKLFDLMLDRVDLCGAGANPDASIMLFKSKEEPVPQKKKPAAKTAKGKADSRSKAKQRGDEEEEEEEEEEAVAKADDDEDDDDLADDDADVDEEEEEEEPPARKKAKKAKKTKLAKKTASSDEDDEDDVLIDDDDDEEEEIPETVMKSLPPSARAAIERNQRIAKRARQDAREARELALTEKSRRERLEFIAKAKKDIPNLTGTEEEKGELMQALYSGTVTKKQADSLVKMLKAADAAQRSLLMSERGSGRARTDEDSALAEIDTLADELMAKDTKLTKAQARTKVCQDNPALYQRYKVEKRRSVDAN